MFSQFEEMHINIAITVQERDVMFFNLCFCKLSYILFQLTYAPKFPSKEVFPPAPNNISGITEY